MKTTKIEQLSACKDAREDVSKQRELLIFFLNHLNKNLNLGVSEMWVDDFIRIGKKN